MKSRRSALANRLHVVAAFVVASLVLVVGSLVPVQSAAARVQARASQGSVAYHGGPVEHSSAVFAVFWAPAGYAFPSGYTSLVARYFTDVAHDSYLASNVYAVPTQYYNGSGSSKRFESYSVAFKSVVVDTQAYPKNGCKNYTLDDGSTSTACLTHAQIEKKLKAVIAAKNFPTGLGTNYFLFTPQGVASCAKANTLSSGGCYNPLQYNGYCAYHSHLGSGANAVIYADLPYAALAGCTSGESPNGNAADAVLNNVAHEHNESMADPLGNAWYDSNGHEIADKCHLMFGSPRGSTGFGQYNQFINGNPYWLQELWSNRAGACVQRNTFPQPSASFTYKPSRPTHGKKVVFASSVKESGESKFTFKWTFPDGGSSTVKNPTHVFHGFVFSGPVTLVVTDPHGGQTRTVRFITVS
jgi:hypothetical protein